MYVHLHDLTVTSDILGAVGENFSAVTKELLMKLFKCLLPRGVRPGHQQALKLGLIQDASLFTTPEFDKFTEPI